MSAHEDADERPMLHRRREAERYADHVLNIAWLRGAADLLFRWEDHYPAGHFGSAGLGLIAANLLDHADDTEDLSSEFPGPDQLHEYPPSEHL